MKMWIPLLLFVSLAFAMGQEKDCCPQKKTDGILYNFSEVNATAKAKYQCADECVYLKQGTTERYCFVDGGMETECLATNPGSTTSAGSNESSSVGPSIDCSSGCEIQLNVTQTWSQELSGYVRTAEVKVPATSSKLPVVLYLHGSGGRADTRRMSKFLTKSVIVAAQGYNNQWNIVKERTKAPDVQFMGLLIEEIARIAQADMDDVTVIGTSNGAGMISRMLIEMEKPIEKIKRVVPMVSHMTVDQYHDGEFWMPTNDDKGDENVFDKKVTPDTPGPEVIYFHGTDDKTVPYAGGNSLGVTFLGSQETTFAYAKAFGFKGNQIADNDGETEATGITKYEYKGDSRVVHYKMKDMSHNAFDPKYSAFIEDFLKKTIEG